MSTQTHLMALIDKFKKSFLHSVTMKSECALCDIKHQYEQEFFCHYTFFCHLGFLGKTLLKGFDHKMILISVLSSRDHLGLRDPERHEEPEEEGDH